MNRQPIVHGIPLLPLLDRNAETLTERPELLVQRVEVLADVGQELGRVVELAVAVTGIVRQVVTHRRLQLRNRAIRPQKS